MTTVYSVMHSEGIAYVPTKAEAIRLARAEQQAGDLYVSVSKSTVTERLGKRELYCALLNGESWCSLYEEVEF